LQFHLTPRARVGAKYLFGKHLVSEKITLK
jgi:hypothetical protein